MKKCFLVLLVAVLAGCASVPSSSPSIGNTEESLKNFLVGTWSGYVVRNMWLNTQHSDIKLQIFEVHKNQNGWVVNAIINGQSPESIELYVQNDTFRLQIMSDYGGLFTLEPHGNGNLTGDIRYGRGRWSPHYLALKKISG